MARARDLDKKAGLWRELEIWIKRQGHGES
jgi:hypothetical protein